MPLPYSTSPGGASPWISPSSLPSLWGPPSSLPSLWGSPSSLCASPRSLSLPSFFFLSASLSFERCWKARETASTANLGSFLPLPLSSLLLDYTTTLSALSQPKSGARVERPPGGEGLMTKSGVYVTRVLQ